MRKSLGLGLVLVAILIVGFGFWASAQGQAPDGPRVLPSPRLAPPLGPESQNPTVMSGNDIGFRVDRWEGDTPVGRWVVRHEGKWVEPRSTMGTRRLTSH
jgi:hypothetical protein